MAPRDTVMPPEPSSTRKNQPEGHEQDDTGSSRDTSPAQPSNRQKPTEGVTGGDAESGDLVASETGGAPVATTTHAQPQGGQAAVHFSALTLAWIWGLLPGGLAGISIAYFLWSMREHVAEHMAEECNTSDCRYATELLKSSLNHRFDPCDDFYSFVCSRFSGPASDVLSSVTLYMRGLTETVLHTINVPLSHQNSTQKAAGLFRACVSMGNATRSEVPSLKVFLGLVGLDLSNMPPDPNFNIAERIVRLNIEYGFPTFVKFGSFVTRMQAKKFLTMDIDEDYLPWLKNAEAGFDVHAYFLHEYDPNLNISQLAGAIEVVEHKCSITGGDVLVQRDTYSRLLEPYAVAPVASSTLGVLASARSRGHA